MKNKLIKNTLVSLHRTRGRFISIMLIIAIGCAFFSGVKASAPYMKSSAWDYFKAQSLADMHIKSSLGLTDGDLSALAAAENVDTAEAGYSADLIISRPDENITVTVYSYSPEDKLNRFILEEGRLPENDSECLADFNAYKCGGFSVGEKITLSSPDDDTDISDIVSNTEYTVVGLVRSPIYVSFEHGSTTVGNGVLNGYVFIPESNFSYEVYTDIYLTGKDFSEYDPYGSQYEAASKSLKTELEDISAERIEIRSDEIRSEFTEKTDKERTKLENAEKEYERGRKSYETGVKQLESGKSDFETNQRDFTESKKEYEAALEQIAESREKLESLRSSCDTVDKILEDYSEAYVKSLPTGLVDSLGEIQSLYDYFNIDIRIKDMLAVYIITDPKTDEVSKLTYHETISNTNEAIRSQCDTISAQIDESQRIAEENSAALEEGEQQFEEAQKNIEDNEKRLEESKTQLDEAKAKIDEGYQKLDDAEAEMEEELADGEWYVFDRDDLNPGYADYGSDTERVDAIAAVFPVFFILIAALVCVCTMTRMVEEQRTETGTLKALGFGNGAIAAQYIMYAAAASIIGSTAGVCIGLPLIPRIIFIAYQTMYCFPYISTPFLWSYFIGCLAVSLVCTGLSAGIAARTELISSPAQLMRPKPPKDGRRVLLERIPFIWKHLSFTFKVTFRNLLRYKSRFFMTVIGIAGCTGLLVTGFGLQYAISSIVDKQFGGIFKYDMIAVIDEKADTADLDELENMLLSMDSAESMGAYQKTKTASFGGNTAEDCYVFAPDDPSGLNRYISLRDRKTKMPQMISSSGVIITEKLSRLLGVKAGDRISIEGASGTVAVTAITENYTGHYIYMTKDTCQSLFGENADNIMLINKSGDENHEFAASLLKNPAVRAVSYSSDGTQKFNDLISSMNLVVVLIIGFAGALAFVILFNLVSISINERVRELATIKVLGFFDGEVSAYIYRENIISTLIGILCGMGVGVIFEKYVLLKCEVDSVMFNPDITAHCYIYAALITAVFSFIVNLFMHFRLMNIDMASSMKAVE